MAKSIAFIPARSGSKGIPGKNKKMFCGKPLVLWSIEQAKDSELFDRIVVSTDDDDIAAIAREAGVEVEKRPAHLATDEAKLDDVMIDFFSQDGNACDFVSLLQPTSPLRTVEDLKKGYKMVQPKKNWSVVGVTWNPIMGWVENPAVINKKDTTMALYLINDRPNRQNRGNFFLENGALYWVKFQVLMAYGNRIGSPLNTKLYIMPPDQSIDLDSPFDWYMAECAWKYRNNGHGGVHE